MFQGEEDNNPNRAEMACVRHFIRTPFAVDRFLRFVASISR